MAGFPVNPIDGQLYTSPNQTEYQYHLASNRWIIVGLLEQGNPGVTGQSGAVGTQGETGGDGEAGPEGSTGAKGTDGDAGVQGNTGAEGTPGVAGETGSQGTDGTQGNTGSEGSVGSTGSQGLDGTSGTTGVAGAAGADGATGLGVTGDQGVTGAAVQGETGLQGSTGETGIGFYEGVTGIFNVRLTRRAGMQADISVPYDLELYGWRMLSLQGTQGSVLVDLYNDTYANFPFTGTPMHSGATGPNISESTKNEDNDLSDWATTSVSEGDVMRVNISSVTGIRQSTLALKYHKT